MNRINRAGVAGLLPLILVGTAFSTVALAGGSGGTQPPFRSPAADAVPTSSVAPVASPTTALPSLPTAPTAAPPPTAAAPPTAPGAYMPLTDDYGMLSVEVPTTWTDYDTRPFVNDDNTLRPGISASTDLVAFDESWDTPGMIFTAFRFQPDPNVLFGLYDYSNACTDGGTVPYNDQVFVGYQRTFTNCSTLGSRNYVIVANAPGNLITIVLVAQTVTPADEAAYQHILETFKADLNVPMPTGTAPPTTTPLPTVPVPTAALPTAPGSTLVPVPTVAPAPTSPPLPTSPLLTTPATLPVPTVATAPVPTAVLPTVPGTVANGVPAGYQAITDDTGRLSIQVPATWIDINGATATQNGVEIATLSAAPNLQTFQQTFDGPGLLIHETSFNADPNAELASRGLAGECTPGPVSPNPNPNFSGVYQSWLDCGGTTADLHVLVANPVDGRQTTIVIVVQTLTPADEEALKVAFSSYALNTTV